MNNAILISLSLLVLAVFAPTQCAQAWTLNVDGESCGQIQSVHSTSVEVNITTQGGLTCVDVPEVPPEVPPGNGPPEPPETPPNTRVVDPGAGMTFLPSCVNGVHWASTNCEFTGSMRHNEYFAIRVDNRNGNTTSFQTVNVSRSETGDSRVVYEIAVSTEPGNFQVASRCKNNSRITVAYEGSGANACLVPLRIMYVNVRTVRSQESGQPVENCGRGLTCRPKITGTFIY